MNDHQTRVRLQSHRYRAECCCGWRGEWSKKATLALVDSHEHSKAETKSEEPAVKIARKALEAGK